MKISTKGRYALRVMLDLAIYNNGEFISLSDVSKRQQISLKYLEMIIGILNKADFVMSQRGKNGGYRLTRQPEQYTVGSILRLTEGSLSCVSCLEHMDNPCPHMESCMTVDFWKGFNKVINNYVDGVTLKDLLDSHSCINDFCI